MNFEVEGIRFDAASGTLRAGGRTEVLRPRTGAVLAALMGAADRMLSKEELIRAAWPDVVVTDDSLTQCIKEIRRALGAKAARIRTLPRRGYVFLSSDPPTPATRRPLGRRAALVAVALLAAAAAAMFAGHAPRESGAPRLVVLPFVGAGGSVPAWFVEGVTAELTDDLARLRGVRVIGRSTAESAAGFARDPRAVGRELGVRYAVAGEIHGDARRLAITVRLIDTRDGTQRWSERFEGERDRLAAVQRRVTTRIARSLELELVEAELARIEQERGRAPSAHEHNLRGWGSLNRGTREEVARAVALFNEATAADPRNAHAWLGLAHAHLTFHILRWEPAAPHLQRAGDALERSAALDPRQLHVRGTGGTVHAINGRFDEALAMLEAEVAEYPSNAHAFYWLGIVYILVARPRQAVDPLERAIEMSPRDRSISGFHRALAVAHLHLRDPGTALPAARQAVSVQHPHRLAYATLAAAQQMAGQHDAARASMREFLRRNPDFTVARLRAEDLSRLPAFAAQRAPIYAAMVATGLPEE